MSGLKPAVIGLIGAALVSTGTAVFFPEGFSGSVFGSASFLVSAAVFLIMLVLSFRKVHPVLIIVLSAVLGIVSGYCIL
jgi:chromate transporter